MTLIYVRYERLRSSISWGSTCRMCEKIFPEGDLWSPSGNIFSHILKVLPHDIDEQRAVHICYIIFSRSTCLLVDILYVFPPKSTCYCHMTAFSQSQHRIFPPK